jgi:DNA mismatch repair ATPase MutS
MEVIVDGAEFRLNVARLANLPSEVISIASDKSRTMEEETKTRENERWYGPA